jgi:hypothetical protein
MHFGESLESETKRMLPRIKTLDDGERFDAATVIIEISCSYETVPLKAPQGVGNLKNRRSKRLFDMWLDHGHCLPVSEAIEFQGYSCPCREDNRAHSVEDPSVKNAVHHVAEGGEQITKKIMFTFV